MNLDYILPMLTIIASIGDNPGRTPRYYATNASGSPRPSWIAKIKELQDREIVLAEPAVRCGRPVNHLYLSPTGRSIYAVVCALRALPDPGEGSP